MVSPPQQPHVVIFPFMAQGHTLPLLDLSKVLSSRGLMVTIITTPSNVSSILQYIKNHRNIHIQVIPFPIVEGLPKGCENTADLPSMALLFTFLTATMQLQQPFEQILRRMSDSGSLPICVISDFFLGWTLATCQKFEVPRFVSHGMGVLSMAISKAVVTHEPHLIAASDSEPLHFPGMKLPFTLSTSELPVSTRVTDKTHPFVRFNEEIGASDHDSSGIIVNSFNELEGEHVGALKSFIKTDAKVWCVGPLFLYDEMEGLNEIHNGVQSKAFIDFLDAQSTCKSIIYVSFGSQAEVTDLQLDEVGLGLEMSGQPFIWVIRSKTWTPPDGLMERTKGKGLIVTDWVDQRSILAHRATGGFLSHCGWNSVMEGLSKGVPLLAWPMMAEQPLNAKFVVEGLKAGLWMEATCKENSGLVGREVISKGVKELMTTERGAKARERAKALGCLATQAVQKGGSSTKNLNEFIDGLTKGQIRNFTNGK